MNRKRNLHNYFGSFSLGPRSVDDFLESASAQDSIYFSSDTFSQSLTHGYLLLDPYNEYYYIASDTLDVSSSGTVLKSLNLTLKQALEDKDFLEAASSLASYYRQERPEGDTFVPGFQRYASWDSSQLLPLNAASPPADFHGLQFPSHAEPPEGFSCANAFDGSFINSFLSKILSIDDYSELIAAYDSFITGISATVANVHRYVLRLITGSAFLVSRIGKSVEGFIAFSTWPRPPTSR